MLVDEERKWIDKNKTCKTNSNEKEHQNTKRNKMMDFMNLIGKLVGSTLTKGGRLQWMKKEEKPINMTLEELSFVTIFLKTSYHKIH
jgi:hypothetical protein